MDCDRLDWYTVRPVGSATAQREPSDENSRAVVSPLHKEKKAQTNERNQITLVRKKITHPVIS